MPYTLALPSAEADRWRVHRDLLDAADRLIGQLRGLVEAGDGQDYLLALAQVGSSSSAGRSTSWSAVPAPASPIGGATP